jgi:hypothetical protein
MAKMPSTTGMSREDGEVDKAGQVEDVFDIAKEPSAQGVGVHHLGECL